MQAELLQCGGDLLMRWLADLVKNVWRGEGKPDVWRLGELIPIHKKNDWLECGNYRGSYIPSFRGLQSVCEVSGEETETILLQRSGALSGRFQGWAVDHRPVVHNQAAVGEVVGVRKDSWHMFVDFRQAYGSVCRKSLWSVMRSMEISGKLTSLVRKSYEGSKCCVRVGGDRSREFEVASGLRQGCSLAPSIWNIALEWVMRENRQIGVMSLGEFRCDRLAYADDVDLMAETLEQVEEN